MDVCKDRLYRLLRYGRKNSGGWDEGECDCTPNSCEMLDDGDVDRIVEGLAAIEELKQLKEIVAVTFENGWKEGMQRAAEIADKVHSEKFISPAFEVASAIRSEIKANE